MFKIDFNCDLGEGGAHDAALMPLITSANIACGGHAGDLATMRETVRLARQHGVAIGAHPGFADRENFGRREIALAPGEVRDLIATQCRALVDLAEVTHVKPHGALYNMAARDPQLAKAIAETVAALDPRLVLFCPPHSELARAGAARGLRIAHEIFADRRYAADGQITPRTQPGALIEDAGTACAQVFALLRSAEKPDTVCLHGDGANPVEFAQRLRTALAAAGVRVSRFTA